MHEYTTHTHTHREHSNYIPQFAYFTNKINEKKKCSFTNKILKKRYKYSLTVLGCYAHISHACVFCIAINFVYGFGECLEKKNCIYGECTSKGEVFLNAEFAMS